VSAQAEIDSLIEAIQRGYNASPNATMRADLLGREALKGLVILAGHIDEISERVVEINARADKERTDISAKGPDPVGRAALSSLVVLTTHMNGIAESIDAISERLNGVGPEESTESADIRAEVADLRRQIKKLTKAVKRLPKSNKKSRR